jgi:hypothetical protein
LNKPAGAGDAAPAGLFKRHVSQPGHARLKRTSGDLKTLAVFRALMIRSKSSQLNLRKGGMSGMRYEFNPLNKAMIGALQDCLLSARPR